MTKPHAQNPLSILVDRRQASKLLSLSTRSIDLLLAAGRLTPVPMGRRVLIARSQLEAIATTGVEGRIRPA